MPGPVGGPGPLWKRAIWVLISCCIALALYNGVIGGNPATAWERLQHKSEQVRRDAEDLGKKIDKNIQKAPKPTYKPGTSKPGTSKPANQQGKPTGKPANR